MDTRHGPPRLRSRGRTRSQAWPWIIVAVVCMAGFVLVFRLLLARTAWSAGGDDAVSDPPGAASTR